MLKPNSYIEYLETLVLSLMTERKSDNDIVINDDQASSSLKGFTCSPLLVQQEIKEQRRCRQFVLVPPGEYRSNDGVTLSDPEEGVQSLAAAGFTETLDCSGYLFLIAKVTTNATSGFIRVFLCAKADK